MFNRDSILSFVVWWPASHGLMDMVETVSTGVVGRQGFDNDRVFAPGCIEVDDDQNILSIVIRGEDIDPNNWSSLISRLHTDRIKLLVESSSFLAAGDGSRYTA